MKRLNSIFALTALGSFAALWPLACSSAPRIELGSSICAAGIGCGQSCEATADCGSGLFCDEGLCNQECIPTTKDANCASDERCDANGKCVADDRTIIGVGGAKGTGGGDTGSGGGNEECIDVVVEFEPQIPTVVLLIDQSGSMDDGSNFGGGVDDAIEDDGYIPWDCGQQDGGGNWSGNYDWRWNVVRNVLLHPTRGIVKPLEDRVRFGMTHYTWDGDTEDAATQCPHESLTTVQPGLNTHAAMDAIFKCNDIRGDIPTRESLAAVAADLAAYDEPGPKVIVLATDGEPDNCECRNFSNNSSSSCYNNTLQERGGQMLTRQSAERYDTVQEAKRIYEELGIVVEVIDVSNPNSSSLRAHLTDVAAAGGGEIHDGTNPTGLSTAFEGIIDGVRSCAIDLEGTITDGAESTGTITLDGVKLELNDADGWRKNTPSQIELLGSACETIKTGDHDLDISFPCGAFEQVVPK